MDYGVAEQNVAIYGEDEQQYEGHYGGGQENYNSGNYNSIDSVDGSAGVKHDSSSSSAGKLFVGGIAWETTEESFTRHFKKYGEVIDSVIMMDKITGRPRGFGFITFADPEIAEKVMQEDHVIDGRAVEVKRTVPRDGGHGRGVTRTKKIFVGGLPVSLTDDELVEYFSAYGSIVDHQIMMDHTTGRSRGFGFVTFESEEAVDKIIGDGQMHELGGKQVEVKRAEPKRSGFDHPTENRFQRGGSGFKASGNFPRDSEGFGGGYGGSRGYGGFGGYGGYGGGYGGFSGNYPGGARGFYPGYGGGYGYGYGFGGPMYGSGSYGGGGYGAAGYDGAAGYGAGKGYGGGSGGGYGGGSGGGYGGGNGGGYGDGKGYGAASGSGGGYGASVGRYGSGKTYGNGSAAAGSGRFHPYRK